MTRVYLSPPDVGDAERTALLEAFDSGWIAPVGPQLDAFERELEAEVGAVHALAVSSGTAALHLALLLNGVGPGDDVLVPTFTFVATANTVRYLGARPVFVDCEAPTWQVDPDLVAAELHERARRGTLPAAVVSVDLYGQSADYDRLVAACEQHGVPLVEDAAEAIGARYKGQPVGGFGAAGVFSFNGNKIITTSSGGALVSSSAELVDRARHLSTQAREPEVHYQHVDLGFNYRLSNLLAALGLAQLRDLPRRVARRQRVNQRYRDALSALPGVTFMPWAHYGEPNYWLTCVLVDPAECGRSRDDLRLLLEAEDIESRPTWKPLHLQPLYADAPVLGGTVADAIFEQGLCLPSGSNLSDADQDRVIDIVQGALHHR
ncbi:MAG TPA: aminotransferase class I/II-fold pyridoxal phosphate-dependent enzyme [Acidimicrobiales bacterium]|nr:aminotransferase class I/II-fold pyridoxal phosphate-dependent enzyme [Acidimicrobiales bacterium]